jgi:transcriptional regulator with GAF, ATPase, and Fis domain
MSRSKTHNNEEQDVTSPKRLLIGASQAMRDLYMEIRVAAGADITVLITGESGVGKELVSREIHLHSARAGGPFLAVNSAALTESLLESRLFGHLKGAFTGAVASQIGLFEAARGGSILFDEIGDMPMNLQGSLLRVLQERTILPLGSHTERRVDVRIIAATNKDLEKEIEEGRFREDLYYRLNQFPIRAPALREHPSDIPLLVRRFLGPVEIEEEALELLCGNHWRGNVRELKATVEVLALRAAAKGARMITADQARGAIRPREGITVEVKSVDRRSQERSDVITYAGALREGDSFDVHFSKLKLAVYEDLLKSTGSHLKAAEWLRLDPKTLHHRIKRLQHAASRSMPE